MRLHKYIINEGINDIGILKATILAGFPGVGKSYVVSKLTSGQIEPRIVNTDKMTEFKFAFKYDDWPTFKDEVKLLTRNQLALYLNSMLPLWIEGTSANPNSLLRRKGILASVGYDTSMLWINTSLETAIERAKSRQREVPERIIRDIYEKVNSLKSYYKKEFRNFMVINNDEGELNDKIILRAFRKSMAFFTSPVENSIGKKLIEDMKANGHKYLSDTDQYDLPFIKKLVSTWYQK